MVCANLEYLCFRNVHGLDEWHHHHSLEVDRPHVHSFLRYVLDLCGRPVADEFFLRVLFGFEHYWAVH